MKKEILIIGGGGYIGTYLIANLSKIDDYNITSIDIYHKITYDNVTYINERYENLNIDFYEKFTDIILLAGQSNVANSKNILEVIDNNIRNFAWLLEHINENQKLIYASSSSVYNSDNNNESTEDFINYLPKNYYDLSKYIIDNIAQLSNKHYYGLRFGTVNGYSNNLNTVLMINSMIYNAKINNKFSISNKNINRPILGIHDLYEAILAILKNNDKNKSGIYNLNSFNCNLLDIANKIKEVLNIDYDIINSYATNYDFKISSEKFTKTFNFQFKETLETIINDLNDKIKIPFKKTNNCKICNHITESILDLGMQPLANNYKISHQNNDELYELNLHICSNCFHQQLNTIIEPTKLFSNYLYISGTSKTLNDYFDFFSEKTLNSYIAKYNPKSIKVLEIACNDGSQLDFYKKNSPIPIITVGVDPALNIYNEISSKKDHDIYCDFFSNDVVLKLKEKYGYFDIIIAQNVFAHINYPHDFLKFTKELMHDNSDLYIQTSQKNMILENQFDTIYHEHLSFFNTNSMKLLCELNDLVLNNVSENPIHGVSYIFKINKNSNDDSNVILILNLEKEKGLYNLDTYYKYNSNCVGFKNKLNSKLEYYKSNNYSIIAFGCTAKSMTIFNYCNINSSIINYMIDENQLKHNLYTPLSNIQIFPIDKLNEIDNDTVIIITAWNFYDEIKKKIKDFNLNKKNKIILLHINTLVDEIII